VIHGAVKERIVHDQPIHRVPEESEIRMVEGRSRLPLPGNVSDPTTEGHLVRIVGSCHVPITTPMNASAPWGSQSAKYTAWA